MKISVNWIKEFVDIEDISTSELLNRLMLSTAEIEEVTHYGKNLTGVVVGKILKIEKAPNSNKLHLLKVDGGDRVYDVVCGAPNCRENMLVAFAKPGANVNGFEIKQTTIAGHFSEGMCCSEKELNISENHEGILEITENAKLGTDIKKLYPIEDVVFEVDNKSLTNRPDLWCHYGFAREVSAIFNRELKPLKQIDLTEFSNLPKVDIKIEDAKNCYRYSCVTLDNVTKKVSPMTMRIRLFYAGMRSLNLLADLTNYVMLEVGQPMHAFDKNKIEKVVVKSPSEELTFKTLDGEERKISKNTLMIYNNTKPVAIAGIMGGFDSEVEENTTGILLESANFFATSVRRSANAINLRTEASMRYEKSLDPELTVLAIKRFIYLLLQIDEGVKVTFALSDDYPKKYPTITIKTSASYISSYCGVELNNQKIVSILKGLGFKVQENGKEMLVTVPSYRATKDVSIEADLVEEVARIYGYDNIKPSAVEGKIEPTVQNNEHLLEYEVKKALAQTFALSEVHSYLWNDKTLNKELNIKTDGLVKVLNSTVKDNDQIRSELTPTLLNMIYKNQKNYSEQRLFEIARVVTGLDESNLAIEEKHLSIVLSSKDKSEQSLYFELKKVLEHILKANKNKTATLQIKKLEVDYLHPVNSAEILVDGKKLGKMGVIHPKVTSAIDKKIAVVALEINFSVLNDIISEPIKASKLSKYQTTSLDFNFLVSSNLTYAEIEKVFNSFESGLNFTYQLIDKFENEEILKDKTSYTFRFEISAMDHTLKSSEIEEFSNALITFSKNYGLELR